VDTTIGGQIKSVRKAAGLTQEALSRRTELSLQAVGDIERGVVADPHISSLRQIARALGVPVSELLEEPAKLPKASPRPEPGQQAKLAPEAIPEPGGRRISVTIASDLGDEPDRVDIRYESFLEVLMRHGLPRPAAQKAFKELEERRRTA
jgi:transcriptional regulator with XRE-family HTH domain